ncbi:MAG: DUF4268 domain-containing protein [Pseudobutyrivibrio sp.]|nr:DUF4268 domain-containing protein [Pseudobutyrivibrio sp.]
MYVIDTANNTIKKIQNKSFHELGFKERQHLQEWIAKNPECLGDEELLIIQKEFDGFSDTNERLDLLALDKKGALVIIENKLDDTGKDVNWQALKYVSYCATLSKQQIIDIFQDYLDKNEPGKTAKQELVDFYNGKPIDEISLNDVDQRMMLVAGNFRKEVTSTAMWMIDHGISVQCFKATPFQFEKELFLDIEQIIPVKEAQEYMIKMADKAKESQSVQSSSSQIEGLRREYWSTLLTRFNNVSKLYANVNPSNDHWLSCGSGVSGAVFSFIASTSYASCEITMNVGTQEDNKALFDKLFAQKAEIEADFGKELFWERLDNRKSCRISFRLENVNVKDTDDWEKMIQFHCDVMPRFYNAIHDRINKAKK